MRLTTYCRSYVGLLQLVEGATDNRDVLGSNPRVHTNISKEKRICRFDSCLDRLNWSSSLSG